MSTTSGTPVCPACGAKFQHDPTALRCKVCGIPDEIVMMGPRMIARWKKDQFKQVGLSKRARKLRVKSRTTRRRRKHGRARGT